MQELQQKSCVCTDLRMHQSNKQGKRDEAQFANMAVSLQGTAVDTANGKLLS